MKMVVPTAEHFGRCNSYTFLDEKGNVAEIINNTSEHMGGLDLPPELMKKHVKFMEL